MNPLCSVAPVISRCPREAYHRLRDALKQNKSLVERNISTKSMNKATALQLMSVCASLQHQLGCNNEYVAVACDAWSAKNAEQFSSKEATIFLQDTISFQDKTIGRKFCLEYCAHFLNTAVIKDDVNKLMLLLDAAVQKLNQIGMRKHGLKMYRRLAKIITRDIEYLHGNELSKLLITYVDMSKIHREVKLSSSDELSFLSRVIKRAEQLLGGEKDEFGFTSCGEVGSFNQRNAISLISKIPADYWRISPRLIKTVVTNYGGVCTASKAVSICQTLAKQRMLYDFNSQLYTIVLDRLVAVSATISANVFERAITTFYLCKVPSSHSVYASLHGRLRGNRGICLKLTPFWSILDPRIGLPIAHAIMCITDSLDQLPFQPIACCLKIWSESLTAAEFESTLRKWKSQLIKLSSQNTRRIIGVVKESHQQVFLTELGETLRREHNFKKGSEDDTSQLSFVNQTRRQISNQASESIPLPSRLSNKRTHQSDVSSQKISPTSSSAGEGKDSPCDSNVNSKNRIPISPERNRRDSPTSNQRSSVQPEGDDEIYQRLRNLRQHESFPQLEVSSNHTKITSELTERTTIRPSRVTYDSQSPPERNFQTSLRESNSHQSLRRKADTPVRQMLTSIKQIKQNRKREEERLINVRSA